MTATRDRDSDLDTDAAEAAWDERPVFGDRRGLPWWGAVLLAFLLSVAGAVVDKSRLVDDQRLTSFGLYQALFLAGCVLAVLGVRRRNLFGPMVQPPLIFAVTFVPVQMLARESGQSAESGSRKLIFEVALPLASSFPWMAGATAATILLGVARLFMQRNPDRVAASSSDTDEDRPARREPKPDRTKGQDRDEEPRRRPSRDREERAGRPPRESRDEWERESDRGRGRPPEGNRREQSPPPRRPAREDREAERGRGEAPPRRNPPRSRDQGGQPRPPQGRRPRD